MGKLIHNGERDGTCYLEFQFCDTDKPLENGKVRCDIVKHWSDNSLYMDWDDFGGFYELYAALFACGVNYYGKDETEKIIEGLSDRPNEEYAALLPWLKDAAERGKGFYILGV